MSNKFNGTVEVSAVEIVNGKLMVKLAVYSGYNSGVAKWIDYNSAPNLHNEVQKSIKLQK